jgi:hypothetical protein
MQATQTRSQGRAYGQRAITTVAVLVAAVLITLSALYFTAGRTASSAHTAPSRVQAVSGGAVGASSLRPDTRDASAQGQPQGASAGLRHNGPLP